MVGDSKGYANTRDVDGVAPLLTDVGVDIPDMARTRWSRSTALTSD